MAEKKLFISDVHIGAGRFSEESKDKDRYPYEWDWLSEKEKDNFVKFIRFLIDGYDHDVKEVVFLGDIFDNWVFPYDLKPPTMEELLTAEKNKKVVEALNDLSQKVRVFYVPGNHDMDATRDVMHHFFRDFTYCPKRYSSGLLIGEHGHLYAMFNAPAGYSDNIQNLPLGYFISRLEATRKARTDKGGRNYKTYVDDFIEVVGKQTLPQSVLEAVMEESGVAEEAVFKIRKKDGGDRDVPAADVKDVYKNIYDDWPTHTVSKHRAVFAELDMLGPIADKLCKQENYKVCIFGHSHKKEIDKDSWFVDKRIYANSGYWCGEQCTFVETERTSSGYDVCIVKWLEGRIERGQAKSI